MSPDAVFLGATATRTDDTGSPREPSKLPCGWALASLGEVLPLEYGTPLPERLRDPAGKVAVYGSSGLVGRHTAAAVIGPTLIVGRKGSAGAVFYCAEDSWPIDTVYFAKANPAIDLRFGYYFLKWKCLGQLDQSTAIPSLSRDVYSDVTIRLAPLAEQRRIVARIDELFAEIAEGEAALERARRGIDPWRRALLKAAVTGELTRDWRQINRPTGSGTALLTHIRAEKEAPATRRNRGPLRNPGERFEINPRAELPVGWSWATLDDLSSLITSGSRGWKQYYADAGSIFIRAQNLRADRLELDDVAYVDLPSGAEGVRTRVSRNDILITITGANVTRSAQVERDLTNAYVNQHVGLVRLKDPRFADFVFLVVICPSHGRRQLKAAAYGAGKPGLNLTDLASVTVPLPPLEEQHLITGMLREAMSEAENALVLMEELGHHAAKLRQSVLKAAFEGRLVSQDPADEPASVLLARLRTSKPPQTRPRGRGRQLPTAL